MDANEQTKIFISWSAPAGLVLCPLALGIVLFQVISEGIDGKPIDLLEPALLKIVAFCVVGFLVCLYICKKELDWFSKGK